MFLKIFGVIGLFVVAGVLLYLYKTPIQQARDIEDPKDRLEIENQFRATWAQIFVGIILLLSLIFTWAELNNSRKFSIETLKISQDRQITERFSKAIENLGSKTLDARLGGIYALERVARDSEKDHWQVMEVLTAFVRTNAPLKEELTLSGAIHLHKEKEKLDLSIAPCRTDIQAILTVLGRRVRDREEDQRLNLVKTNLRKAHFEDARLERADFEEAQLEFAHFDGAHLDGADFNDADLRGARDLLPEQLCKVETLYGADLDKDLRKKIEDKCRHLLENPKDNK